MYRAIAPITRPFALLPQFDALREQHTYRTQEYRLLDGQVVRRGVTFARPLTDKSLLWEEGNQQEEWCVFDSALDGYIELFEAMLVDFRHLWHWAIDQQWDSRASTTAIERTEQIIDLLRALRQQVRERFDSRTARAMEE